MFHAVIDDNHLQLFALQVSPPALRRQAGAGGLGSEDDDVLSRRRTISGPEALPGGQSDMLLQEPVQPRPEPRPRSTVVSSSTEITDGTATLRRKRLPESESQAPTSATTTVVTMTTGSDTVRRRTRASEQTEKDVHSNNQGDSTSDQSGSVKKHGGELQQNGGVVLRRRPVSEVSDRTETNKETCEWMEARKSLKPPVSPKPVTLRKSQADPPTPTRRVPIPGPESTEPAQSPGEKPPYLDIFITNQNSKLTDFRFQLVLFVCDIFSCLCPTRAETRPTSCLPKAPWAPYSTQTRKRSSGTRSSRQSDPCCDQPSCSKPHPRSQNLFSSLCASASA